MLMFILPPDRVFFARIVIIVHETGWNILLPDGNKNIRFLCAYVLSKNPKDEWMES